MKTLKWFSLEWSEDVRKIVVFKKGHAYDLVEELFDTELQAFDWLEANGYIERIKQ